MRYILTLFLLMFSSVLLYCGQDNKTKKQIEKSLAKSTKGKEFLIAIPPNEDDDALLQEKIAVEIYIASQKKTSVKMQTPDGKVLTKTIDSMSVLPISTLLGELSWDWEVYESETIVKNKTIAISADDSVTVYVINDKSRTADGFLAYPTESWGTKYVHVGYYDHKYYSFPIYLERGGGFLIIAKDDDTSIEITLKGRGDGETVNGKKIGEKIKVLLKKGEIFPLRSNGKTHAKFDLTGSEIISDKPIGVISFHQRTSIPSDNNVDGKDHLSEMLVPVSAWGSSFTSLEFKRKNKGDFFRVVSAYDNTSFTIESFDQITKKSIYSKKVSLPTAGDFWEYNNNPIDNVNSKNEQGIKGVTLWKSDKPVCLMHYSYSASYDGVSTLDPFMTLVVPEEQFVSKAVFQTPVGKLKFGYNYLNLIIKGDSTDTSHLLIKSVELDGIQLLKIYPELLTNRIPGTNNYYITVSLTPAAHILEAKTKFGGYIYGFDYLNSYGWPAAMKIDQLAVDKSSPAVSFTDNCGRISVTVADSSNYFISDELLQEDRGIKSINVFGDNVKSTTIDKYLFLRNDTSIYVYQFDIILKNVLNQSPVVILSQDNASNYSTDTIHISDLKRIVAIEAKYDDNTVQTGSFIQIPFVLQSNSQDSIYIDNFIYTIKYLSCSLFYNGSFNSNFFEQNSSSVAIDSKIEGDSTILTLSFKKHILLPIGEPIFELTFLTLLHEQPVSFINYSLQKFMYDDLCVYPISPSIIKTDVCARDLRQVTLSPFEYKNVYISPSICSDNILKYEYSIGLTSLTDIYIINNLGEKIKTIQQGIEKAGVYSKTADIGDISQGMYYLVIKSGEFLTYERFALIK